MWLEAVRSGWADSLPPALTRLLPTHSRVPPGVESSSVWKAPAASRGATCPRLSEAAGLCGLNLQGPASPSGPRSTWQNLNEQN